MLIHNTEKKHYIAEKTRNDTKSGYRSSGYKKHNNRHSNPNRKGKLSHNILPPPSILEAYNDIVPESADQLFEMSEAEQRHRHDWENNYLQHHILSYRIGQLFGLITVISLITAIVLLSYNGNTNEAKYLTIAGFLSITLISLLSIRGRKFARRPNSKINRKVESTPQDEK